MKALSLATAALALAAAANLSPAMAQGPKPSGGNTWPGISQRIDTGSPNAGMTTSHYELQYHYRGRHARWVGEWVLVR
jgi:hypothetical protein